jgi:tetratricopeptide (TPR) repeat protein
VTQAAAAYEAGRCGDVMSLFEGLPADAAAALDGVSLYRWGFCVGSTGRGDAFSYYRRAAEKLQVETAAPGAPLDAYFYRVNALLNLDLTSEATAAAKLAVERFQAGSLTVPQDDAGAWFRLGKLYNDAGDPRGAMTPFGRALDAAAARPGSLRTAYLERIANAARLAGDDAIAQRANAMLLAAGSAPGSAPGAAPDNPLQRMRALVRAGQYDEAGKLLAELARDRGDVGMVAQYAQGALDRVRDVTAQGGTPEPRASVEGRSYPGALSLEEALSATGREGWAAIGEGRVVEVPRKNRSLPGTRPAASWETMQRLLPIESRFAGLLLDAVSSGAPLREWAVQGGFAPLILQPWERLVIDRDSAARQAQVIDLKQP